MGFSISFLWEWAQPSRGPQAPEHGSAENNCAENNSADVEREPLSESLEPARQVPEEASQQEDIPKYYEGQEERHQQMLLTLSDLGLTMDPVVAARVYNNKHCPLTRLPAEILLEIVRRCSGDEASLCCLRSLCSVFHHLVGDPIRWSNIWRLESANDRFLEFYTYPDQNEACRLLQRDGLCETCRRFPKSYIDRMRCKFACWNLKGIGYYGPLGTVPLCEHVQIPWIMIKKHLDLWRIQAPDDLQGCVEAFNIECRHPSHDTRCSPEVSPTWPRAGLKTTQFLDVIGRFEHDIVVLYLEWAPHSGFDALTVNADSTVNATDLRAIFKKQREGLARRLAPAHPVGYLPEMECFTHTSCKCVHFKGSPEPFSPKEGFDKHQTLLSTGTDDYHHYSNHSFDRGNNGHGIRAYTHRSADNDDLACLVTSYTYEMRVCETKLLWSQNRNQKIRPSHQWLHAMDPDTYTMSHAGCRDEACLNHYKRLSFSERRCNRTREL